ncbi:Hypothetical predicted protein [Olea europaea subsp. europaea]|uniref:Uncharacterized protein n=1 Tax=Olea europaea subsp. europaea TaxID=158383 RepID=A0A8S0SX69_OLEEU|nr:Hypothetical predicted protein [Olea europaea subsp. europaea]
MNPNEEKSSISATKFVKIGSVFPTKRERVLTLVGRKIVKAGKKAVKSVFDAVKKHKDKRKTAVDAVNKHEDKAKLIHGD